MNVHLHKSIIITSRSQMIELLVSNSLCCNTSDRGLVVVDDLPDDWRPAVSVLRSYIDTKMAIDVMSVVIPQSMLPEDVTCVVVIRDDRDAQSTNTDVDDALNVLDVLFWHDIDYMRVVNHDGDSVEFKCTPKTVNVRVNSSVRAKREQKTVMTVIRALRSLMR